MDAQANRLDDEQAEVWNNRYHEARRAGIEHTDAIRFARSDTDIGQLRQLVRNGCAPRLIVRIVL